MGGVDGHIVACLGLPVFGEELVVLLVELSSGVIADIEQRYVLGLGTCGSAEKHSRNEGEQKSRSHERPLRSQRLSNRVEADALARATETPLGVTGGWPRFSCIC